MYDYQFKMDQKFAINIVKNHSYQYIYLTLNFLLYKSSKLKFQFCSVFLINSDCITPDHISQLLTNYLESHRDFQEFHLIQGRKVIFLQTKLFYQEI